MIKEVKLLTTMLETGFDKNFFVVKFVGLPRVLGCFPYACIHKSWIITSTGENVMVACPKGIVSINNGRTVVFKVYSAIFEYSTGK